MADSLTKQSAIVEGSDRLRLILMGTGPFAIPAFQGLVDAGHEIALVVTRPKREVRSRKGPPPSPVREFAAMHQLELYDPPSINTPESIAHLAQFSADLLVVCDFGQILSNEALATARLGGINLHGSLLPAYRGAAPVQRALLSGDSVTGISVIHMTPRLDGGPILESVQTLIGDDETAGQLEHRLSLLGIEPTLRSVQMLARWDGASAIGVMQDPAKVSRAPRLDKESGKIDWTQSTRMIGCHVRGMQPWPGAFTELMTPDAKAPLRIAVLATSETRSSGIAARALDAELQADQASEPGTLLSDKELRIATGDGEIRIDRLQVAGRAPVDGEAFLRGHRLPVGARLGTP